SLETSAWTYAALPPAPRIRAATLSPASSATSVSTTFAPSTAKSSAATMPMPLPAPVINATFPSSRPIGPSPPRPTLWPQPLRADRREHTVDRTGAVRRTVLLGADLSSGRDGVSKGAEMTTELMVLAGERTEAAEGRTFDVIEPG